MEIFWLDNPDILFKEYKQVLPTRAQTSHQQLNALTRLVFLITLILLVIHFDFWYVFLLASLILILLLAVFILDMKNNGENYSEQDDKMGTTPISFESNSDVNIYSQPVSPGTVKVQTKATRVRQSAYQDIDEMAEKVTRLPRSDFSTQDTMTSRVTYENERARRGNKAAFESSRHAGSAGYLNSDRSGISSEKNLERAKEYAVNDYYQRENIRREKLLDSYAQKRENDSRHYLESGGYEPPHMQNKYYYRDDVRHQRTHNGYVIL